MAGWHHWLDGHESEWTPGVGDGQGGLACCDSWGRKESDTTEQLIWSDLIWDQRKNEIPGTEEPSGLPSMGSLRAGHDWSDLAAAAAADQRRASQVALVVKNLPANTGDTVRQGFDPWVRKISCRRASQPTPVFSPGESHGQRSSLKLLKPHLLQTSFQRIKMLQFHPTSTIPRGSYQPQDWNTYSFDTYFLFLLLMY